MGMQPRMKMHTFNVLKIRLFTNNSALFFLAWEHLQEFILNFNHRIEGQGNQKSLGIIFSYVEMLPEGEKIREKLYA